MTTPSPMPTYPVTVVNEPGTVNWDAASTLVGLAGVLLAIWFAYNGARQVRKERRRMHELDLLRDVTVAASDVGRGVESITRLRYPLLMLPDACPVLRAFAGANPAAGEMEKLRDRLREAFPDRNYPQNLPPHNAWPEIEQDCLEEIEAAIRSRLPT